MAQGGVSFYRQNNFMKLHEEARQGEVLLCSTIFLGERLSNRL